MDVDVPIAGAIARHEELWIGGNDYYDPATS